MHSITDCLGPMTPTRWERDGSLLLQMIGTDYDGDLRWSLHAARCKTSGGSDRRRQRECCSTFLVSAHDLSDSSREDEQVTISDRTLIQ